VHGGGPEVKSGRKSVPGLFLLDDPAITTKKERRGKGGLEKKGSQDAAANLTGLKRGLENAFKQ